MLLILSSQSDESTNYVIDWLALLGVPFFLYNERNHIINISCLLDDASKSNTIFFEDINKKIVLNMDQVCSYWYRRGDLNIIKPIIKKHKSAVHSIFSKEWSQVKVFLFFLLENKKSLGSFEKEHYHNKLITLYYAQRVSLKIPKTLVSTNKTHIFKGDFITKSIGNMFRFMTKSAIQSISTQRVSPDNFNLLGDYFFPTLFQNEISKEYELRIFFIEEKYYAMAIFSQLDSQTSLDYRNYNHEKPNRMVPYNLPNDILQKLKKMMTFLRLNTGSIDMIVTPEQDYCFIEVNPVGQFGWLSYNCNYHLEREIALFFKQ